MTLAEIQTALTSLRPQLLRFARLQLRSDAAAEDVVQDALVAAIENASDFKGEAAVKTWVFAILRNKIVDAFRRNRRNAEVALSEEDAPGDDPDAICQAVFDEHDHWVEMPARWGNPDAALEQKRFWTIFEACLDNLPASSGRVFMMREFLGLETTEICKELSITTSNCWVLLHRARLGLRECLDQRWFGTLAKERS